jgi:hypothetical protein
MAIEYLANIMAPRIRILPQRNKKFSKKDYLKRPEEPMVNLIGNLG